MPAVGFAVHDGPALPAVLAVLAHDRLGLRCRTGSYGRPQTTRPETRSERMFAGEPWTYDDLEGPRSGLVTALRHHRARKETAV